MDHEQHHVPELIRRLQERRVRHLQRGRFYRVLFAAAGFTVLLAGLIMLVTPGPALAVIPIGLAMLALEFAWAESLLHVALRRAELTQRKAKQATRLQKVLSAVATALAIAAAAAAVLLWDIPLLPV